MSVKLHFASPADSSGLHRSRSFTGFGSMSGRRSHGSFVNRISPMSRISSVNSSKRLVTSQKTSNSLEPQPIRVEKICKSLRKGLNNHLESHQNELDLLTMQQKDMKRNSRLAFLYDLDKHIKTTERYIRKLEFHISRIEELYESYFIQWRLRNGANNMRRAYMVSPIKGSQETLLEINRNYRLCTEDMCVMERTLEIFLGEFHIRMKGLIGFARLCPGDHYEVLIRYGRQRWKLKGKIDANDRQTWDEEEMVFLPHINEDIEIKVAEMKGLMTVLVGTVTCESSDFFTAKPQIMIVDITDLGTIKLQLEVMWHPFDADEISITSGSVSKFSWPSRKGSVYNWTPPSTPSFRDKYFSKHIGQEDKLPTLCQETRGTFIFNNSENCFHSSLLSSVPENEKFYNNANIDKQRGSDNRYGTLDFEKTRRELSQSFQGGLSTKSTVQPSDGEPKIHEESEFQKDSRQARQFKSCSALAESVWHLGPQLRLQRTIRKPAGQESTGQVWSTDLTDPLSSQRSSTISCTYKKCTSVCSENLKTDFISVDIGNILQEILIILKTDQRNYEELQNLERQVLHLGDILKKEVTDSGSASTVSLTVETALESFNFLNADSVEDNLSCSGSFRIKHEKNGTCNQGNICLLNRSGDLGIKAAGTFALTSKNQCLDKILLTHLQVCKRLLQRFSSLDSVLVLQNCILEELSQQILVLETLAPFCYEKSENIKSVEEVLPKSKRRKSVLSFWGKCTEGQCILHLSTEHFLTQLRNCYSQKVAAKYPGQTERIFRTLLLQIVSCCELLPCPNVSEELVTVFQFFNYVKKYNITQLGTHLTSLGKEVFLPEALHSTYKIKALKKLKEKLVSELQPLHQTLLSISILQLDENPKIAQAATSFLRSALTNNIFRTKALAYYTEILQEKDAQHTRAACMALKQLKAVESIEQIASLCHSQAAHVHNAAREALLSFGEKGRLAYEKVDKLWYEGMKQNSTTQITIL